MIPPVAHFIWFGTDLPWVHLLAVRSALVAGGFERAVLHHADELSASPWWPALLAQPGFEARRLDVEATLTAAGPHGEGLFALFSRLRQPAARANMVRAALLAREGGVYLDLDTITIKPFGALLASGGVFCGEEHVALPGEVRRSRNPAILARAGAQLAVRDALRRIPGGWRPFRWIEDLYPRAVNNAVLGAEAEHPFMLDLLERMVLLPPERQLVRFALGTHLLQEAVAAAASQGRGDVVVHPPELFYPLGPEISEHWFRIGADIRLADVLSPRTRVVHWYASVRTKDVVPQIDPDYVRRHAHEQLFSALAQRFIEEPS